MIQAVEQGLISDNGKHTISDMGVKQFGGDAVAINFPDRVWRKLHEMGISMFQTDTPKPWCFGGRQLVVRRRQSTIFERIAQLIAHFDPPVSFAEAAGQ